MATQCSLLLVVGNAAFVKRIDYPRLEQGIYELRDVVSRKKQLLPYLKWPVDSVALEKYLHPPSATTGGAR